MSVDTKELERRSFFFFRRRGSSIFVPAPIVRPAPIEFDPTDLFENRDDNFHDRVPYPR